MKDLRGKNDSGYLTYLESSLLPALTKEAQVTPGKVLFGMFACAPDQWPI